MKKTIILLSAMAVAALASCEKEVSIKIEAQPSGVPFELTASAVETKTTNDGMVTAWKANDAINLFHAETATTDYSENDQFTITSENLAANKFTGTLTSALDPAKSYDWYALYPYNVAFTTPENDAAYVTIGGNSRTQTGYDNADHLGGLPLVGKATNVAAEDKPAVTMNHMAAVVKIVVSNSTSEALTITNVSLTTPQKITGQFIVDFSDPSAPVYSDGTYNYNYCNLKVNGGTALGNGESATFYIPIKPVALAMGDEISIKVNTYTKAKTMPSAFSFTAGKITTINFDYDKTFTTQVFSLASSITAGDKVIIASGKADGDLKVMGRYSSGNNIPAVAGFVYGEHITTTSSMGVYTVGGDGSAGYTFYDDDNEVYLNATSTKNNYLKGIADTDEFDKWGVTITDGVAEILNKGTGKTSYHIRYNSSSDLFSAYTSAQTTVCLYKLTSKTPVALSFAESEISKTSSNYAEFTGQVATSSPSVSGITYAITGDAIGTVNASTGAVTLNGTAGNATVTASYAGDVTYAPARASYTITVVGNFILITTSTANMPASYGTANAFTKYSLEGYDFMLQQFYKNGTKLQLRAAGNASGTGTIYNDSTFPGSIKTIIITYDESDANKNCTVFTGSTKNPTAGTEITPTNSGSVYTFDCSANSHDYFVLANGSGAGYITSIKIEWK